MNYNRRTVLAAGAVSAVGFSAATGARAAETVKVRIPATRTAFEPNEVTIKVGDTVEWTNRSIIRHTATCDPALAKVAADAAFPAGAKPFDSGDLIEGKPWRQTFTVAGTYKYFCREHETMPMTGTIIVEA